MKLIIAFFRLIRWPNLVFIVLTQLVFYYAIYSPLSYAEPAVFCNDSNFILIVASSVLIAAGGYIINDYFDLQIDQLNKPGKVVVDKIIKRRWTIVWHWLFSLLGIALAAIVSYKSQKWYLLFFNSLCVVLLWLYSTVFKKKLLVGNIIIALLSAWVVLVVYFYLDTGHGPNYMWNESHKETDVKQFFKLTMVYAGFAFMISLVREVVKDMEDMYGDAEFGCDTMPIRWGIPVSKMFVGVWVSVAIAMILILQLYAWQSGWAISVLYSVSFLVWPLIRVLKKIYTAANSGAFHSISTDLKWIMLAGILSMLFFKYYAV